MFQPASMHQSIPAEPSTSPAPPPEYCGAFAHLVSAGGGAFANFVLPGGQVPPRGHSRAFDTHAVSYQFIATKRILLGKKADWLICQGQEKIEEGCKGMFLILCMHFFIGYQARISQRNWELLTWINIFWLLNQISVNVFGKHPFIFIKLFITYNFTALY